MRRALVLILILMGAPAHAALVHVLAVGEFSNNVGSSLELLPFPEPVAGTVFTLTFTYDSEAMDNRPDDPKVGEYGGAIQDMVLSVGNYTVPALTNNWVVMLDDADNGDGYVADLWIASTFMDVPPLYTEFGMALIKLGGNALASDALIMPSFPEPAWNIAGISYTIWNRSSPDPDEWFVAAGAYANLQSVTATVVPLPPTFVLLAGALLGLAGYGTRKTAFFGSQPSGADSERR